MQRQSSNLGSHSADNNASSIRATLGWAIGRKARTVTAAVHTFIASRGATVGSSFSRSLGWRVMTGSVCDWIADTQIRNSGSQPGISSIQNGVIGGVAKRLTDIVIASIALLALAPAMLVIVALVRVTMGGPVIFAHTRVGLNGRTFPCFKFRSMINAAEEHLNRYLAENPELSRQWQETQKLGRDPRVTTFGALLRKSSLDELPQLFNVLRGEMSLVGPRPVTTAELERYGADVQHYLLARPGLTGLWQVSGRRNVSYLTRVALDSLYVRNWSLLLDFAILARTIPVVAKFSETA